MVEAPHPVSATRSTSKGDTPIVERLWWFWQHPDHSSGASIVPEYMRQPIIPALLRTLLHLVNPLCAL